MLPETAETRKIGRRPEDILKNMMREAAKRRPYNQPHRAGPEHFSIGGYHFHDLCGGWMTDFDGSFGIQVDAESPDLKILFSEPKVLVCIGSYEGRSDF